VHPVLAEGEGYEPKGLTGGRLGGDSGLIVSFTSFVRRGKERSSRGERIHEKRQKKKEIEKGEPNNAGKSENCLGERPLS